MSRPRTVGRAARDMGVSTAVSRSFGLLRVLVITAVLGTTFLGNTFQASNSVSNVLFELLAAGALSAVLVPTFVDLLDRGEQDEAERLAGGLLGLALIGLGVVAILGIVFAPALARALTAGNHNARIAAQQRALSTYLLRFFVPQVILYAYGAIATAVLYARRRFAVTAAAPIGNTLVIIACLVAFRLQAGPTPGFDLSGTERLLLALAGTGGVAAFVGTLAVACHASGFRLRPRRPDRDPAVRRLLALSFWGLFLNAGTGMLLGAALVIGNSVEGGVVAYQAAFVFFLAPYAVLAQPIHTAMLPEMSGEAARGELEALAASVRRGLGSMGLLVVPASVAYVVFAVPMMKVVSFGAVRGNGVELLAAGVASLGIGLYAYGAFLLLARAYYALGESRTPAVVAVVTAGVGVVVMAAGAARAHGAAKVAALGIGHSTAYLLAAVVLGVGLSRRTGRAVVPEHLARTLAAAFGVGALSWLSMRALAPHGRVATLVVTALVGGVAAAIYIAVLRVAGARLSLHPAPIPPASP
ncbi:MAG: putative peptidoglycan lipid flippase [Actinomycetota bacterium]|nr:putative peptidoglycan lipid flippase [Actinomycetota bacterium]